MGITGYLPVGEHTAKLNIPYNTSRCSCQIERKKAKPSPTSYVKCECPALSQRRYKSLDNHIIHNLVEIAAKKVRELRNFLNSTTTGSDRQRYSINTLSSLNFPLASRFLEMCSNDVKHFSIRFPCVPYCLWQISKFTCLHFQSPDSSKWCAYLDINFAFY